MDYDIINGVIDDIYDIVNRYNYNRHYSYSVCKKLVLALFGYYLVYGEGIFKRINMVLDSLCIYECDDEEDYKRRLVGLLDYVTDELCEEIGYAPLTTWSYKCDGNNKFRGAIPYIAYIKGNDIGNVFTLAHEIAHTLDGTSAQVIRETDWSVYLKQGFTIVEVDKMDGTCKIDNRGMSELVAVSTANKILRKFMELDTVMVEDGMVREFLVQLKKYNNFGTIIDSYANLSIVFKDLMDNDLFMDIIGRYYFTNEELLFRDAYEKLGDDVSYVKLKSAVGKLIEGGFNDTMYYSMLMKKEIDRINSKTGFEAEKRLIVIV